MSAAGIPSFIEDKAVYDRETSNAVYDVLPYVLSNTFISLPFISLNAIIYTIMVYPLIHLHPGFIKMVKFGLSLFLSVYTAETIILTVSAVFPIFVIALSISALIMGFFTIVLGFLASTEQLPVFWLWAHYISYETYGFEMMIENDFPGLMFSCAPIPSSSSDCFCSIPSSFNSICQFSGQDVLNAYGYPSIDYWSWFVVLIAQIIGYRFLLFAILWLKKWKSTFQNERGSSKEFIMLIFCRRNASI
jgi:ABC-type multidrug transport system permease subunit